ncbi:hypothetical protein EON77_11780, partial [bacterium]
MGTLLRVASSLVLSLSSLAGAAELPALRIDGNRIVDAAGTPVTLRGVNLGNWLMIETGNFGGTLGDVKDQHAVFTALRDRFGEAERRRLIGIYRDHYITARDFDAVKRFDFNLVRVGLDYELFEDDERPMRLRDDAFKYLDFAVREAKARGIYVWFDLHRAQEHQVNGRQGGREGYTRFWADESARERSLWLWEQIAERYKDEPAVFGYEPLNEPFSAKPDQLRDYCAKWYERIRKVDAKKVVLMPNIQPDRIDFYGKPKENGWTNAMFDLHFYPGSFDRVTATQPATPRVNTRFLTERLPQWSARMREIGAPLAIGEMNVVFKGAGGGEMIRRWYDYAAREGWPITIWTLKELTASGGAHERMWMITTNAGPLAKVDIHTAPKEAIEAYFRGMSTMPLMDDPDTLHWLTTKDAPRPLTPATR